MVRNSFESQSGPSILERLRNAKRTKKVIAGAALTAAGLGVASGALVHEQGAHAEVSNAQLNRDVTNTLALLANQDSKPGLAIVEGKTVTIKGLQQEKEQARQTIESRFKENRSIQINKGTKPGDALWEEFTSSTNSPDTYFGKDKTLDQSEQVILTVAHAQGDYLPPEVSRVLLSDVSELSHAMDEDNAPEVEQLQTQLEDEVKELANATFDSGATLPIPDHPDHHF